MPSTVFSARLRDVLEPGEDEQVDDRSAVYAVEVPNGDGSANAARNFVRLNPEMAFELLCLGAKNARANNQWFISHKRGGLGHSTSCAGLQEIVPQSGFAVRAHLDVEGYYDTAFLVRGGGGWNLTCASSEGECFWNVARQGPNACSECGARIRSSTAWLSGDGLLFCGGCVQEGRVAHGSRWRPPFNGYCSAVRDRVRKLCTAIEQVTPELLADGGPSKLVRFTPHVFTASSEASGKASFHVTFEALADGRQAAFRSVHDVRRIVTAAAERLGGRCDGIPDPQRRLEAALSKLGCTRKGFGDVEDIAPVFDPAPLSNGRHTGREATRCWRCPLAMKLKERRHVRPLLPVEGNTLSLDAWRRSLVNVPADACVTLRLAPDSSAIFVDKEGVARHPDAESALPQPAVGYKRVRAENAPSLSSSAKMQLVNALFPPFCGVPPEHMPPGARPQMHSISVGDDGCIRFRLEGANARFCRCKKHHSGSADPAAHLHRSNTVLHVLDVRRCQLLQLCNDGGRCLRRATVPLTDDFRWLCDEFVNSSQ